MALDVIDRAVKKIAATMPPGWRLSPTSAPFIAQNAEVDGVAKLIAPDGTAVWLIFEAKTTIDPRDVPNAVQQLNKYRRLIGNRKSIPIVVAPFLTRRTRESLENAGMSYVDLTGNIRLKADRPAV